MSHEYEEMPQKYFILDEWNFTNRFTYDDNFGFCDVKIFDMQNRHRFYYQMKEYGLPCSSSSFCTAFSENNRRNRLIQRHVCHKQCFWDPQQCFLEDSHSGNLTDLMSKDFHDLFGSSFTEQFNRDFSDKIDWSPTGGLGHYPSIGLNKLIEDLGITTKVSYDSENSAINFDNLSREFRDTIPVRPLYVVEEKKCQDIIEALLNINHDEINRSRLKMQTLFDESYRGNGIKREPILSIMMWGPYADMRLHKTDRECKLDSSRSGMHVCTNFGEKHFWMYVHSDKMFCNEGPIKILEGPAMTSDLTVIYPCNRAGCNEDCLCDLCVNRLKCPGKQHIEHVKELNSECIIFKEFQCQEHDIDHPDNFDEDYDISVDKNIFYHNPGLVDQPRQHSTGKIKFAGTRKKCRVCRTGINNHFKHHKVIHLQCKYCVYQLKTAIEEKFWERVCSTCGKILPSIKSLKYWHQKTHGTQWNCDECDINFTKKWSLRRHLMEIHGMSAQETNQESELDNDDDDATQKDMESEEETDLETSDAETDSSGDDDCSSQLMCIYCDMEFSVQRYLDTHVKEIHTQKQSFKCDECDERFKQQRNLKRHLETVHGHLGAKYIKLSGKKKTNACDICGTNFSRADNLDEHIKRAHFIQIEMFTCPFCEKKFDRKWNLKRHESKCILKDSNMLDE